MISRIKTILALLVLAVAGVVPQAHATAANVQLWIAGSTALWQAVAISAYNSGKNVNTTPVIASYTSTCHFTTGSTASGQAQNFNVIDTRLGKNLTDTGGAWVVWSVPHVPGNSSVQDCAAAASSNPTVGDVWAFANVDSVVGLHAYFTKSTMNSGYAVGSTPIAGDTGRISQALFACTGADHTGAAPCTADDSPSQNIWNYLAAGTPVLTGVNVAATDIRPEDGAWAMCRINSPLGPSTVGTGHGTDSLDGLGYSTTGAAQGAGECPAYNSNGTQALKNVFGNPILSGYPVASGKKSQVAAFNVTGKDPATNTTVPAYTVYPIGAVPIIFIKNQHFGKLSGLTNASERQLQTAFSGGRCDADVFGLGSAAINVFLREPLSGTYNTTEATVMRYPTIYPTLPGVIGTSMETGVGAATLSAAACTGSGLRYRGIGTGEEVKSVQKSNGADFGGNAADGIGFTFFSYGNINPIAQQADYAYVQLNGVDPLWQTYNASGSVSSLGSAAGSLDPGQPGSGALPLHTPCGTGGNPDFPCSEQNLWSGGYSFPNVRNGTYRSWSLLRLVSTGTPGLQTSALVAAAKLYSVNEVPDFVPVGAVKVGVNIVDPGLTYLRSHYLQRAGDGTGIGTGCPVAGTGTITGCKTPANAAVEVQGDMGGSIIPTNAGGVFAVYPPGVAKTVNGVSFPEGTGEYQINKIQGSTASDLSTFTRPN